MVVFGSCRAACAERSLLRGCAARGAGSAVGRPSLTRVCAQWHADGSPNPAGVPDAHSEVRCLLPGGGALIADLAYGWECRQCAAWVDSQPRAWEGADEPEWWYWCAACRKKGAVGESAAAKSKKQKDAEKLAARCHKISFGAAH